MGAENSVVDFPVFVHVEGFGGRLVDFEEEALLGLSGVLDDRKVVVVEPLETFFAEHEFLVVGEFIAGAFLGVARFIGAEFGYSEVARAFVVELVVIWASGGVFVGGFGVLVVG